MHQQFQELWGKPLELTVNIYSKAKGGIKFHNANIVSMETLNFGFFVL